MHVFIYCFFWNVVTVSSLIFHYGNSHSYYFSPFFPDGIIEFNFTASAFAIKDIFSNQWDVPLSLTVTNHGKEKNNNQLKGKIGVLTGDDKDGKWREDYIFRAQDLGLVGLVVWTSWVPDHFSEIGRSDFSALRIPCVSLNLNDLRTIQPLVESGNSSITLISGDSPNQWTEVYESLAFFLLFKIGLCTLSLILIFIATHRLILWFFYFQTCKNFSKIAVLCLSVELLTNMERAAYFALGGVGGYPRYPFAMTRIMYTVSIPLTYLTTALTTAYLHEVLTSKAPLGTFVKKTKKPLCALIVFYCLTDWPLSTLSALQVGGSALLATISASLLTAGMALTALLLMFITCKLQSYFKRQQIRASFRRESVGISGSVASSMSSLSSNSNKNKNNNNSTTKNTSSLSFRQRQQPQRRFSTPPDQMRILLSRIQHSLYALLFSVIGFVLTLSPLFHCAIGFVCINSMIFFGLAVVSLLHILAYGKTPPLARKHAPPLPLTASRLGRKTTLSSIPISSRPPSLPRILSSSFLHEGSPSLVGFNLYNHSPLAVLPEEEVAEIEILRFDDDSLSSESEEPLAMLELYGHRESSIVIEYFDEGDEAEGDNLDYSSSDENL